MPTAKRSDFLKSLTEGADSAGTVSCERKRVNCESLAEGADSAGSVSCERKRVNYESPNGAAAASSPPVTRDPCDLTSISDSPSKISKSRGTLPFANAIPLALGINEGGQQLSLSEFVDADVEALLPGLGEDERQPFTQHVLSEASRILEDMPQLKSRLLPSQLESLGLGQLVKEEITDLLCELVSRTMGATFFDGIFVTDSLDSDRLGVHLARGTDNAKTLVFPCITTQLLLADPQPDHLPKHARRGMLTALKSRISKYTRFLCSQYDSMHFKTIDMLRNEGGNSREICARLADSGTATPELGQGELFALNSAVASLFEDTTVKAGPGMEIPLQDASNDCCFHTVLYQSSVLSGKPMPDTETCRKDAARLRAYTVLLAYAEILSEAPRDANLPNLQQLWRQWKVQRQNPKVGVKDRKSGV
jgi:hypothetical protein